MIDDPVRAVVQAVARPYVSVGPQRGGGVHVQEENRGGVFGQDERARFFVLLGEFVPVMLGGVTSLRLFLSSFLSLFWSLFWSLFLSLSLSLSLSFILRSTG